jgi:hypothetical protein
MASSGIGVTKALRMGSTASIRERVSAITSVAETSPRTIAVRISDAEA